MMQVIHARTAESVSMSHTSVRLAVNELPNGLAKGLSGMENIRIFCTNKIRNFAHIKLNF